MKKKKFNKLDLAKAIKKIQLNLGEEAIRMLGDEHATCQNGISTGIYGLDKILGTKGLISGRIYELFGPEGSGKTSLALQIVKSFQSQNKICAFIDAEHSLNPDYAKKLNIKLEDLIIAQPDSGENAFNVIEALIKTNEVNLIIVDSVAALTPQTELDGDISDNQIGLQARLMSKGLRKITANLAKSSCVLIFINQLRHNISKYFGSTDITPGGRALKFYASVRLDIRRTELIYQNSQAIGNKVRIKIIKNKMYIPFKYKIFDFIYGSGIDYEKDFIETLILENKIIQKGPYYYIDDKRVVLGKDQLFNYFKNNPNLKNEFLNKN